MIIEQDIEGFVAHTATMGMRGILSEQEVIAIVHNLETLWHEWKHAQFTLDAPLNDVPMKAQKKLIEMAAKLHEVIHRMTGRSQ